LKERIKKEETRPLGTVKSSLLIKEGRRKEKESNYKLQELVYL